MADIQVTIEDAQPINVSMGEAVNISQTVIQSGVDSVNGETGDVTIDLDSKQDTLVSGTNIKTLNGETILGAGDIKITGGGGSSQLIASTSIIAAFGGYDNESSGGNVTYNNGKLTLDTGTGSNYIAARTRANANFVWWDLDYSCRMSWAQLSIADGASIILGIGQPNWSGNTFAPFRGIWLIAKKISSTVVTYTLLSTDGTITGTQDVTGTWVDGLSLSFDKRGSEINYYANGVLLGTNTTGIPTSATYFSGANHVQIYAALTTGATTSRSRYYLYDATTDFYAPSA